MDDTQTESNTPVETMSERQTEKRNQAAEEKAGYCYW